MAFEKYVPETDRQNVEPKATLRPTGLISFDANAVQQFGLDAASHAAVYFDRARKIIGIKPLATGDEKGAFELTKRRNTVGLKPTGFLEDARLIVEKPIQLTPRFSTTSKMITLDVKDVPRKRGRRKTT